MPPNHALMPTAITTASAKTATAFGKRLPAAPVKVTGPEEVYRAVSHV